VNGQKRCICLLICADITRLVAVKKAGSGHLGSSLSAMDITVYLYLNEMNVLEVGLDSPDRDIYFSSKGHDVPGLYALFYALGIIPEEKLLMLRRLHGLDGHPEVRQPGIEASTGSLGMGISKAKGMAWAKNYNKVKVTFMCLLVMVNFRKDKSGNHFRQQLIRK
jgi:transketolase